MQNIGLLMFFISSFLSTNFSVIKIDFTSKFKKIGSQNDQFKSNQYQLLHFLHNTPKFLFWLFPKFHHSKRINYLVFYFGYMEAQRSCVLMLSTALIDKWDSQQTFFWFDSITWSCQENHNNNVVATYSDYWHNF